MSVILLEGVTTVFSRNLRPVLGFPWADFYSQTETANAEIAYDLLLKCNEIETVRWSYVYDRVLYENFWRGKFHFFSEITSLIVRSSKKLKSVETINFRSKIFYAGIHYFYDFSGWTFFGIVKVNSEKLFWSRNWS